MAPLPATTPSTSPPTRSVEAEPATIETISKESAVWHEPVDLADTLDAGAALIRRHAALPELAAETMMLWIAHTHAVEAAFFTPRLAFLSAEKGSGKTTMLDLISLMARRPVQTVNISAAAMFRLIAAECPTLLIDEVDAHLKGNEDLRSIINGGHRRGGTVLRVQGEQHQVRQFQTFAPAALAGIGDCLPDTVHDRSIIITMRRAMRAEAVERLRVDKPEAFQEIAAKLARVARDKSITLEYADPLVPDELGNRGADNWRPLLAMADLAGAHWPGTARRAAIAFAAIKDDQSLGVQMLYDWRELFAEKHADIIGTNDALAYLHDLDHRPWGEYCNGRPLTPRQLATLLSPYGIIPTKSRALGGAGTRGYQRADFEDAWKRYLPG